MYQVSVLVYQEFFKIPMDIAGKIRVWRFSEVFKQRANIIALNAYLGAHREGNRKIVVAECLDILVGAGFLSAEIIGRETYNNQFVFVSFVQFFQFFVLWGKTTLGGCVNDEYFFALVFCKVEILPGYTY